MKKTSRHGRRKLKARKWPEKYIQEGYTNIFKNLEMCSERVQESYQNYYVYSQPNYRNRIFGNT